MQWHSRFATAHWDIRCIPHMCRVASLTAFVLWKIFRRVWKVTDATYTLIDTFNIRAMSQMHAHNCQYLLAYMAFVKCVNGAHTLFALQMNETWCTYTSPDGLQCNSHLHWIQFSYLIFCSNHSVGFFILDCIRGILNLINYKNYKFIYIPRM